MTFSQEKLQKVTQDTKLDALIVPIIKGKLPKLPYGKKDAMTLLIEQHLKTGDLPKAAGSFLLFYPHTNTAPKRIMLLEIGTVRNARELTKRLKQATKAIDSSKRVGVLLPNGLERTLSEAFITQTLEASFNHTEHKSGKQETYPLETVIFFTGKNVTPVISRAEAISRGVHLIKTLGLRPANFLTPTSLAHTAEEIARKNKLTVRVLGEEDMKTLGMGGILGVSQGSQEEAKFIILEYKGGRKTVGLVGKGITFDSGGISIKPSRDMHEMKFDMIGGATVLALVQIAAELKLPVHIIGIVAATENMPGGKAQRPGDVITTYSGKTVEIINTDAEGRMVLADALSYLYKHYKPDVTIDLATLTGAVIVSLGNKITGAFGNSKKLNAQILTASEHAHEPLHFLPLFSPYNDELKSKVADLANIGKQKVDAIIGALFLEHFIPERAPWVHLDIAGTAWHQDEPTGSMVPTLVEFLERYK